MYIIPMTLMCHITNLVFNLVLMITNILIT